MKEVITQREHLKKTWWRGVKVSTSSCPKRMHTLKKWNKQEGQHPLTRQRTANFRLLANQ